MKRLLALTVLFLAPAAGAQTTPRGWQMSALPTLNFNSDDGFGYGAAAHGYHYGDGTLRPYKYTIQPQVFLTTKGRRDLTLFFDAPHLLPGGWRVNSYLGYEQHEATPYYGIGNNTTYDKTLEEPPNPYFYRYGRKALRFNADFQRSVKGPLRVLVGTGYRSVDVDQTPHDSGATLLAQDLGAAGVSEEGSPNVRTGLVYDTRDQETGPTRGQWIEGLVQRSFSGLTRVTGTARTYVSLNQRVVWAQRFVAQNLTGDAEFYELNPIQGSFKDDEGLGGSGTVRGLPKNRFIGKGMVFANEELRWRAVDFMARGRESAVILSAFADAGRVWERGLSTDGLFSDYHLGYGGGARLRYGPNFVIALDVGHSKEATAPIYIGLGYLF